MIFDDRYIQEKNRLLRQLDELDCVYDRMLNDNTPCCNDNGIDYDDCDCPYRQWLEACDEFALNNADVLVNLHR